MPEFLQPEKKRGVLGNIGLGLSAFGAGVQGRGPEFLAGQTAQREKLSIERQKAAAEDLRRAQILLGHGNIEGVRELAQTRIGLIQQLGGDPSDTAQIMELANASLQGDENAFNALTNQVNAGVQLAAEQGLLKLPKQDVPLSPAGKVAADIKAGLLPKDTKATVGTEQSFFESLKRGLSEEQQDRADLVKLGLIPRAATSKVVKQGGLYGSADPVSGVFTPFIDESGNTITVASVAAGEAEVAGAKEFGKLTGASRSKSIDEGFTSIKGIEENNRNIDLAIEALDVDNAKTGYAQKFLPSIRTGSVKLANVRNRLGLDVIGSVRFGALSEGERQMAMETAIPTDLNPPQLIEWLNTKKAANNKMIAYFNDQIDFLDNGGTIAGYIRKKEREAKVREDQGEISQIQNDDDYNALPSGAQFIDPTGQTRTKP